MALKPNRGIAWEVVGVPFAKGVDLRTRARLVAPTNLLKAENVAFPATAGVSKRFGHSSRTARTSAAIPQQSPINPDTGSGVAWSKLYQDKTVPSNWLYGWGLLDASETDSSATPSSGTVSPHPNAGVLLGSATRDNEELVWDGFRLFSSPLSGVQSAVFGEAQKSPSADGSTNLPSASLSAPFVSTSPIAKGALAQLQGCVSDTGRIKVVTWLEGSEAYASVYDSVSSAPLRLRINLATDTGVSLTPVGIRSVPIGGWVHVFVSESGASKIYRMSVSESNPTATFTSTDLGSCAGAFDVRKINDSAVALVLQDSSNNALLTYFAPSGSPLSSPAPQRTTLVNSTHVGVLGFDVHPVTGHLGLAWQDTTSTDIRAQIFTQNGLAVAASFTAVTLMASSTTRVSVGAHYIQPSSTTQVVKFQLFVDANPGDSGAQFLLTKSFTADGTMSAESTRLNVYLASQAFRVGAYPFALTALKSPLQTTYFIMDCGLYPVGKMEYGTASVMDNDTGWIVPVNFKDGVVPKDRMVFHTALMYNLRVDASSQKGLAPGTTNVNAVFTEASIKECRIDFLPRLRSVQAGRCTYFAGAQVWEYDGRTCVEAGFHHGAEDAMVAIRDAAAGGALVPGAKYRYYIQPAYRNAQGEEVRGPGFLTSEHTVAAANDSLQLELPYIITRRTDAYYLVYRNENSGTLWYLITSRDPASCPANSVTGSFYVDKLSDANLIKNELAPANPVGYLETYSAPACEVISFGKDRVWVAGGEIPPGQIFASRLFQPMQAAAFNPELGMLVSRGADPVTGIGFVEDTGVVFLRDKTFIIEGDGPDNLGTGAWQSPRLALAEVGSVSPESVGLIPHGLAFQSPAGIRLIGPGGELVPLGLDVDPVAKSKNITATVVVPDDQQIRFYSVDSDALVYDYLQQTWSTWTGLHCWGAVKAPNQRRALLARPNGEAWSEVEGLYSDAGAGYMMRVRTAWLHAGQIGGFQRVRRVGFFGEISAVDFPFTVTYFYDESVIATETRTWDTSADLNTDAWGGNGDIATFWGDGAWGDSFVDTSTSSTAELRERVFRVRFRTARQKCSAISVEFDDGAVIGPGVTATAVFLEVGSRAGVDRIPAVTIAKTSGGGVIPN